MKNQYTVNRELMKSWAKDFVIKGAADVFDIILTMITGLCGIFIIGINLFCHLNDWLKLYLGVLFLAFFVYRLFFARFIFYNKRYKQFSKIYGVEEWQRTTEFLDDEIVFIEHNSTIKLQYKNIKQIREFKDRVFMFFEGNAVLRLEKNAFVDCTWEECEKFIEERR